MPNVLLPFLECSDDEFGGNGRENFFSHQESSLPKSSNNPSFAADQLPGQPPKAFQDRDYMKVAEGLPEPGYSIKQLQDGGCQGVIADGKPYRNAI
jgi:hypothetical protein